MQQLQHGKEVEEDRVKRKKPLVQRSLFLLPAGEREYAVMEAALQSSKKGLPPSLDWRQDQKVKEALVKMTLLCDRPGITSAEEKHREAPATGGASAAGSNEDSASKASEAEVAAGGPLVMVLDETNYVGHLAKGALIFRCSMCTYVGERYYHAGTFHSCAYLGPHYYFGHCSFEHCCHLCAPTYHAAHTHMVPHYCFEHCCCCWLLLQEGTLRGSTSTMGDPCTGRESMVTWRKQPWPCSAKKKEGSRQEAPPM